MTTASASLRQHFDRGMTARLTLLLTADGSPRLLDRWLAEHPGPSARCALTAADNRPMQFLAHLSAALEPIIPAHHPEPASCADPLDVTGELLNALLSTRQDFPLVLENYQAITAPAVHAAVTLMVDYPPPQMHLYIVSTAVPPLPLARLRVRQQLVEIDLREVA